MSLSAVRRSQVHPKSMDAKPVGDQSPPYNEQTWNSAMFSQEPVQEGLLPSLDKRRMILERARQVLLQARKVTEELDRIQRGPHGSGSAPRFSVGSPTR